MISDSQPADEQLINAEDFGGHIAYARADTPEVSPAVRPKARALYRIASLRDRVVFVFQIK